MSSQLVWFKCPECGNRVAGLEGSSGWCVGSLQSAGGRHKARRLIQDAVNVRRARLEALEGVSA